MLTVPHSDQTVTTTAGPDIGKVDKSFYVIGVGASAGGLDAIKRLLSTVPDDFAHSFVVVQHLSPDYKSLMVDILARDSQLKVVQIEEDMPIEPGRVYLIPPGHNVIIQGTKDQLRPLDAPQLPDHETGHDGEVPIVDVVKRVPHEGLRFALIPPSPRPGLNLPIDIFFRSLAEAVKGRGLAIVLSGTGSDGSRGIRAVKDYDGFVVVQDPQSAEFDGMPRTAINTGLADAVIPPEGMVDEITRYMALRDRGVMSDAELLAAKSAVFLEMLDIVSDASDIDFRRYKVSTLQRRILRRMSLRAMSDPEDYLEVLRSDPDEPTILSREFLVGVTNFFRDLPVWRNLEREVLATLFETGDPTQTLRVWSVGCSTGEEAFSIAMLMELYRKSHDITRDFRVYATDVNEAAIKAAKQGLYPESVHEEIPEEFFVHGFLTARGGLYRIAPEIRNRVVFSVHNAVQDPPFTNTDLIVCRNMLIYLGPDVQAKAMTQFTFSLRKDGVLLLGASETPGQHGSIFEPINAKSRIFINRRVPKPRTLSSQGFSQPSTLPLPRARRFNFQAAQQSGSVETLLDLTLNDADALLCVIDENARILKTFGQVGGILQLPDAGFSSHLLDLIDDRLRSAVLVAIRRAEIDDKYTRRNLRLVDGDTIRIVDVHAQRTSWEANTLAYAVRFVSRHEEHAPEEDENTATASGDGSSLSGNAYVAHLESEVKSLQAILSATAEDLGTSNEELQTTNEELNAANEELQATNEETQSVNEELHTIAAEHAERIRELEAAHADIENLLATADLGMLVLSRDLRIRRFSAGLSSFSDIQASDIGRPLDALSTSLPANAMAKLIDDARIALETRDESGREFQRGDGGWLRVRTRPFYGDDEDAPGVVINLMDLTETKLLQQEIRDHRARLDGLLGGELAGHFEWSRTPGGTHMSAGFKASLGYVPRQIGDDLESWTELIHKEDLPNLADIVDAHILSRDRGEPLSLTFRVRARNGRWVHLMVRGRISAWTERGAPSRALGVIVDVSNLKKEAERDRKDAEDTLTHEHARTAALERELAVMDEALDSIRHDTPERMTANSPEARIAEAAETMNETLGAPLRTERATCDLTGIARASAEVVGSAEGRIEVDNLPEVTGDRALFQLAIEGVLQLLRDAVPSGTTITVRPDDGGHAILVAPDGVTPADLAPCATAMSGSERLCAKAAELTGGQLQRLKSADGPAYRLSLGGA